MINYSRTFEINFHKLFEDKQAEIERVNAQIDEAGGAEVKDLEKKISSYFFVRDQANDAVFYRYENTKRSFGNFLYGVDVSIGRHFDGRQVAAHFKLH